MPDMQSVNEEQRRCVIIADPEPESLEPLVSGLRRYGYLPCARRPAAWNEDLVPRAVAAMVIGPTLNSLRVRQLCRAVRQRVDLPLIVVSPDLGPAGEALTLEAGADYCLLEHAATAARSIVAIINAIERRETLASRRRDGVINVGPIQIDLEAREVVLRGRPVAVTPTEFGILCVLAQYPGRVVSAFDLLAQVHGGQPDGDEAQGIVKVHISRLRQKLEDDPEHPRYIANVRGQGYMYMLERRQQPPVG